MYRAKSDWFYSIQFWSLKQYFICENRSKHALNCDTNVRNILASLARIFLWWSSFYNSFEACFNFNLIMACAFHWKRKKTGVLKGIIIAHHHTPTWWVACDFSHVCSLWISWQGVWLSHVLVFHMPNLIH